MSASLNEYFVCGEFVKNLTRILQGFGTSGGWRCRQLSQYHSRPREVNEAGEDLLILRQLLKDLLVCPGKTTLTPIHDLEFIYSFIPPWKQCELLQCPGPLAVEAGQ